MKEIFRELKNWGVGNIIWTFLLSLFFLLVARKINLQMNFFGVIYIYITCLCIGHYLIYNVKPGYEWKFKKSKMDTFLAIPVVGAITFAFWAIIITIIDIFFNIFLYFNNFWFYI
tara:strand:- start:66 stop:410 length:345 start_codon:yes stop_codon:yes gene_type:complete